MRLSSAASVSMAIWMSLFCVQLLAQQGPSYPDPKLCKVIIDDIGDVGFRISDGQQLIEQISKHFRERVGRRGVIYEGRLNAAEKMKRMLNGSENEISETKMTYLRAAMANAKHRVHIRFGAKKGKQWIELTCFKVASSKKRKPLDKLRVTGTNFLGTFAEVKTKLPGFCIEVAGKAAVTTEKNAGAAKTKWTPSSSRNKPKGKWKPPPRRD
ncbi:MAG: hypothetical protein GY822_21835 [Deltaproteobacteria bacterium]|nr:hypothetical protein [Deltaproteobacteria bacterium]